VHRVCTALIAQSVMTVAACLIVCNTVPVEKVEWELSEPNSTNRAQKYEGVSSVDLHEGQVRRFVCRVNGSFPQPEVIMNAGHRHCL